MDQPVGTQAGHGMVVSLGPLPRGLFCPMSARSKSHPTRKLCPMTILVRVSLTLLDDDSSPDR